MTDEQRKYLMDIRSSIEAISFHLGGKRDYFQYLGNLTVKRAVEREIEIIGEATSRLLKLDDSIAISNARKIVDLRNKVIHAYDAVNDAVVWKIVVVDIPKLSEEVGLLLNQS